MTVLPIKSKNFKRSDNPPVIGYRRLCLFSNGLPCRGHADSRPLPCLLLGAGAGICSCFSAHGGEIADLMFSPFNDDLLATSGRDATVKVRAYAWLCMAVARCSSVCPVASTPSVLCARFDLLAAVCFLAAVERASGRSDRESVHAHRHHHRYPPLHLALRLAAAPLLRSCLLTEARFRSPDFEGGANSIKFHPTAEGVLVAGGKNKLSLIDVAKGTFSACCLLALRPLVPPACSGPDRPWHARTRPYARRL